MPEAVVGTQRLHLLDGVVDYAVVRACAPGCQRGETTGLGDLHTLPLGVDRDYEVLRGATPNARRAGGVRREARAGIRRAGAA